MQKVNYNRNEQAIHKLDTKRINQDGKSANGIRAP